MARRVFNECAIKHARTMARHHDCVTVVSNRACSGVQNLCTHGEREVAGKYGSWRYITRIEVFTPVALTVQIIFARSKAEAAFAEGDAHLGQLREHCMAGIARHAIFSREDWNCFSICGPEGQ